MNKPSQPATALTVPTITDEQFRLLVHSVRDYAIFLLDPDGHVISWNEGAQRIKGYTEAEIVGQHFSVFYPEKAKQSGWPEYELVVAAREGRFEDEGWRIRKDGSRFWADVVITAVRDETGTLRGFAKVTRDLTERKIAEEAVRLSEERYRTLVEAVRDYAIFMLDPTGHVVTWNSGAQRLKGYTADEIVGKHISVFYPPEVQTSGYAERELHIAATEGRFEDNGWRVRKDGSRFWANIVLTAMRDRNGVLQGFSKVTRDISERRAFEEAMGRLNRELRARVDQLDATNRALGEKNHEIETFVYSVSHDVRGPLVNLQGFNQEIQRARAELQQILDSDPAVPAELRQKIAPLLEQDMPESCAFMETAVAHLASIVDGLLRLSRAGRVVYDWQTVNVTSVLHRIVDSVQGSDTHSAEIRIGALPPAWADPAALEQVFSNLISNALRYRDPSRPLRIAVEGRSDEAANTVTYSVQDNGLGIPKQALPELFTAFRRFHPEAGPGEGMGLTVVRRVVERLGGKICVESTVGQGSTFYVQLPAPKQETR